MEEAAADCWHRMEVEVFTSVFCHHLQVEEAAADGWQRMKVDVLTEVVGGGLSCSHLPETAGGGRFSLLAEALGGGYAFQNLHV